MWTKTVSTERTPDRDNTEKLHDVHQGIIYCHLREKMLLWWAGLSKQLTHLVVSLCQRPQTKQGTYDYEYSSRVLIHDNSLLLIPLIWKLHTQKLPSLYQQLGRVSSTLWSQRQYSWNMEYSILLKKDNGPQLSSHEFMEFITKYQFTYIIILQAALTFHPVICMGKLRGQYRLSSSP